MSDPTFKDFIEYQLPIFDENYASKNIPVSRRSLKASMDIVNYCIQEVEGDSKEDFLSKKWFKSLHSSVESWYLKRYGDCLTETSDTSICSVVLIYGTPFKLKIPTTKITPDEEPNQVWVHFLNSIHSEEKPIEWIVNPPNLKNLSKSATNALSEKVSSTALLVRRIKNYLLTSKGQNDNYSGLLSSSTKHLEKCATEIFLGDFDRLQMSYWEAHLAIEKMAKVLLNQRNISYPRTHDIIKLFKLLAKENIFLNDEIDIANLIDEKTVIDMRYAQGPQKNVSEAYDNYELSLKLVEDLMSNSVRKYRFEDAKFLIKKGDWEE